MTLILFFLFPCFFLLCTPTLNEKYTIFLYSDTRCLHFVSNDCYSLKECYKKNSTHSYKLSQYCDKKNNKINSEEIEISYYSSSEEGCSGNRSYSVNYLTTLCNKIGFIDGEERYGRVYRECTSTYFGGGNNILRYAGEFDRGYGIFGVFLIFLYISVGIVGLFGCVVITSFSIQECVMNRCAPDYLEQRLKEQKHIIDKELELESKHNEVMLKLLVKSKKIRDRVIVGVFKSLILLVVLELKRVQSLWISLICLYIVPIQVEDKDRIYQLLVNNGIRTVAVSCFVSYILIDYLSIVISAGRHLCRPWQILILYENHKEFFLYRWLTAALYWVFLFIGASMFLSNLFDYSFPPMPREFVLILGYFSKIFKDLSVFFLPMFTLIGEIINTMVYDGFGSVQQIRKLRRLKGQELLNFPEVKISFFEIFSIKPAELIEQVIFMISLVNSKKEVEEIKKSSQYKHLRWKILDMFSNEEVKALRTFFSFSTKYVETFEDIVEYYPLTSPKWFKYVFLNCFYDLEKVVTSQASKEDEEYVINEVMLKRMKEMHGVEDEENLSDDENKKKGEDKKEGEEKIKKIDTSKKKESTIFLKTPGSPLTPHTLNESDDIFDEKAANQTIAVSLSLPMRDNDEK